MSWMDELNGYKRHLISKGVPEHMADSLTEEAVIGYVGRCATDEAWLERVKSNPHLRDEMQVTA